MKCRDWTTIRCVQCGNVERYLIPKDPFKASLAGKDDLVVDDIKLEIP